MITSKSSINSSADGTTDNTTDNNSLLLERYIFSSKPTSSSTESPESRPSVTSTRQTTFHQTSISHLSSTLALNNNTSPPGNDPFHGFSFTQEAAKKHRSEFSLVSKLSGKPGKSKILKKLGSKITSRKSKEKYQLTISAAKQTSNKNKTTTDMNGLTLLKRRVVDQLYNNVMSPAVGVKVLENLELAFPFVPKTTRSHKRLRTSEELTEQYKVEFNDLVEKKKIKEKTKENACCLFAYNNPKLHRLNLWKLSQLPPITYTATDCLALHKEDKQYYNLRFVQKRSSSNLATVTDEETHSLNHNFGLTVATQDEIVPENRDSVEKDYPMDASVSDSFEEMDDSVIITMENSNTPSITTKFTQNDCMGDVITLDSSPANSLPASSQARCSLLDLSPRHGIPPLSPRHSALLTTSPSDPITVLSIPETPPPIEELPESPSPFPNVPIETVEVIEIPESPIAENDDFDSHFSIIEHAAAKFGLRNTSPKTLVPSLTMPSLVHGNSKKSSSSSKSEKQDFSKLTTPQLREQMDKWGFKPVRTRKAMIELLESCNVVVEPVQRATQESQAIVELPDLTLQVVDKMSTGEMKKTLSKLGIKHSGSRSQMTSILVSWSQSRSDNLSNDVGSNTKASKRGNVTEIADSVNNNLSKKILEAIKMEHEKHSVNSLWTRMLCYEPISLDELAAYLETKLAVKLDDKFLRSWCDAHGVTTTTVNSLDG